jgi:dihydropyrimidine dehydrogenase (NAD+) subunit PreT
MSEYKKPQSQEEFDLNFAPKKPLMNDTEAYYESSRCLFCYDAPCIQACPTHIDIPLFIRQINTGNNDGAATTIYDSNWLGNACGTVCPTGVLCEGACVYNHQDIKPIEIGRLQNYATNQAIQSSKSLFTAGKSNGKKVAIIGAGPAGIACACELRVLGYEVAIFEAKDKPTGLTIYGIAPYKITNEEAEREFDYLQSQLGFSVYYNSPIINKEQLEELENEYDAVFLGVGLGATAPIHVKGEDLENVIGAVEFIAELRMKKYTLNVPKKVIVLGGGNTAMDAASESARMGASEVILAYRRSKEEMGAYDFEYKLAISSGVRSLFNVSPIEIMGEQFVTGVRFIQNEVVDGELRQIAGSEFEVECDMVIRATGQQKQVGLYQLINELQLDKGSRILVNKNFQTTNPKYFAGGDAVNGGAEVVNAAYEGKMAALGIHSYLKA